jgi:hypothetical protein
VTQDSVEQPATKIVPEILIAPDRERRSLQKRRLRLSDSLTCQSRGNLSHHRMDMDVMTAIALHDGYRLALALFSPCPRPKQEAATF